MVLNAKQKGNRGERMAIDAITELLPRSKDKMDRRNSQATPWGGSGTPDITIKDLRKIHFEIKHTASVSFFAWAKQLLEDVLGTSKLPCILYRMPANKHPNNKATWWVFHPLSDIEELVLTWAPALGYRVEKES